MPQLMPLNWQVSFLAVFLLIFSGCLVYSVKVESVEVGVVKNKFSGSNMMWCW